MIILELMPYGDLKDFLIKQKSVISLSRHCVCVSVCIFSQKCEQCGAHTAAAWWRVYLLDCVVPCRENEAMVTSICQFEVYQIASGVRGPFDVHGHFCMAQFFQLYSFRYVCTMHVCSIALLYYLQIIMP